ncbi:T9SS type A sorting domain-containing protein [candidate division WOR-3 bacterium]|uniref:T9SS type A sorting domain-containing protein n=1 Tax=candidate division WOR-3 bacterium TaxID=2052148 RepID=A0A937XFY5_UNCW3|nr:T9SS type A sorting domain-containing protein [candidate division WOR-3 bacterium]
MRLIDCRNDSVLVDTVLGEGVAYLEAHTGDGEKVYIAHGHQVDVLDASSLAVLTTIVWKYMSHRGDWPSFVYSDSTDKLYWFACDNQSRSEPESALVIDTRGDTIVARLSAGVEQRPGCLDHTGRFIFCPDAAYDNSLVVYDSQIDSVAAVYSGLPVPVCVKPNPERAQIYVGCDEVILVYPDAPPGVQEAPNVEGRVTGGGPTVVKRVLVYAPTSVEDRQANGKLLDASGRKAMNLQSGENDVRALSPGVYFVRTGELGRTRKIVITR